METLVLPAPLSNPSGQLAVVLLKLSLALTLITWILLNALLAAMFTPLGLHVLIQLGLFLVTQHIILVTVNAPHAQV